MYTRFKERSFKQRVRVTTYQSRSRFARLGEYPGECLPSVALRLVCETKPTRTLRFSGARASRLSTLALRHATKGLEGLRILV